MIEARHAVIALAMGALLVAPSAAAQRSFPASRANVAVAACAGRARCRVEFVLSAGDHAGMSLAVVRVRVGRTACVGERDYHDDLVGYRDGAVHVLRELVHGRCPCLEWRLSRWRYARGELLFDYGMMGAPPASGADVGETTLRVRPWPVRITGVTHGGQRRDPPPTPAQGPLMILTME